MADRRTRWWPLCGALLLPAGAPPAPAPAPAALPALPPLAVEQTEGVAPLRRAPAATAGSLRDSGRTVTLTAANVDLRVLLPLLAEAAGVSLVLGPEVRGTVSVSLRAVPARAALESVLEEAGLSLAGASRLAAPWGPTVFYPIPVNVTTASAETIRRRFDVSAELARFVVESRPRS